MTFYEVFIKECERPPLMVGAYVTEHQKESIRINGDFLEDMNSEYFETVAKRLVGILQNYNQATDGGMRHVVQKKQSEKQREKDINKTTSFINMLESSNRFIRRENIKILQDKLIVDAKELLESLYDDEITFYVKRTVSNKQPLRDAMGEIIKKYNLSNSSKKAKKFIDNLDEPYKHQSDSDDPYENY